MVRYNYQEDVIKSLFRSDSFIQQYSMKERWNDFLALQNIDFNAISSSPKNDKTLMYCLISVEIASVNYFKFDYESRLQTFQPDASSAENNVTWSSGDRPSAAEMARCGFYRCKPFNKQQTICFHCGVKLADWSAAVPPAQGHANFRPQCAFMTLMNLLNTNPLPYEAASHLIGHRLTLLQECFQLVQTPQCRWQNGNLSWMYEAQEKGISQECSALALCRILFRQWSNTKETFQCTERSPPSGLSLSEKFQQDAKAKADFIALCQLLHSLSEKWPIGWQWLIIEYIHNDTGKDSLPPPSVRRFLRI